MYQKLSLLFTVLIFSISAFSQDLEVKFETENPSQSINDAVIKVVTTGGVKPYSYQWSFQDAAQDQFVYMGAVEGEEFTVTVTDAVGNVATSTGVVATNSIEEKISSIFRPVVKVIADILFWDPFSFIGIYDPVVYSNSKVVKSPGWDNPEVKTSVLSRWLIDDGEHVQEGDEIATVTLDGERKVSVIANAAGILTHTKEPGQILFDPDYMETQVNVGSENLASIRFDEPQPVLHPNGEVQKKNIPFIVIWLIFGALFFTIKMGFINFRGLSHAMDLIRGKFDNPNDKGEVSHFQALTTALSATVGLGNIAGVAVAITIGGPGATFWIILAGFLGMASKFVECSLGVKYRKIDENGVVSGGPMYYLSEGLKLQGKAGLGKVLAVLFAILCIGGSFGGGNMFQANQAFAQMSMEFPMLKGQGFYFGLIMAIMVAVVIIGGIKSIANVTDKIVPFMCAVYVLAALVIIGINYNFIGEAFSQIFNGAFNAPALKGGFMGVLIIGFQRAAFSNEAGIGSASIAHSASKTDEPISEGVVALLEPFVDTVIVCTMTALVLVFTGFADGSSPLQGSELTSAAFDSIIPWFSIILAFSILLFAFSTMISWSYYGLKAWTYLFGDSKLSDYSYKTLFLVFIVIGASVGLGAVLDFSDLMILGMAFPNILGLLLLSSEVRQDLKSYFARVKSGAIKKFK